MLSKQALGLGVLVIGLVGLLMLAACAPTAPLEELTPVVVTVIHTRIAEMTVMVTQVVTVTVEVPVTVTPTPTPVNTPTPTNTPTITPTPTNTATPTNTPTPTATPNLGLTATAEAMGVLAAPRGDGFYTVGVEIAPGKWHSTGAGSSCYWARYDANQKLLGNHFGVAGGTMTIRPSDYEVEVSGCGRWQYVEGQPRVLQADAEAPKDDGFYTVGVEIAVGRWKSTGTEDDCYWARLGETQSMVANHFGNAGGTVTVRASDYEVYFNGCGMWEYLGP